MKKYYFINKFNTNNIDKQDGQTTIIFRNYSSKEINEDLIIRTTLDVKLQEIAENSVNTITSKYTSADQSALVALDLTGGVMALSLIHI